MVVYTSCDIADGVDGCHAVPRFVRYVWIVARSNALLALVLELIFD